VKTGVFDACSGVVEIPESPEARHERRSKGIETTELLGNLRVQQQYDGITTREVLEPSVNWMFVFHRSVANGDISSIRCSKGKSGARIGIAN